MKTFVKAMNHEGVAFMYLKGKYELFNSVAKLNECSLGRKPQKLFLHDQFTEKLSFTELDTWE